MASKHGKKQNRSGEPSPRGKSGYQSQPTMLQHYQELLSQLKTTLDQERNKNQELTVQLEAKNKKEKDLVNILTSYTQQLKSKTDPNRGSASDPIKQVDNIKSLHSMLLGSISTIQENTGKVIQDQGQDISRKFNSKLKEINKELEDDKKKQLEHVAKLEEQEIKLSREMQMIKATVVLVEEQNKVLYAENKELRQEIRSREEEVQMLHSKFISFKRTASQTKVQLDRLRNNTLSPPQTPVSNTLNTFNPASKLSPPASPTHTFSFKDQREDRQEGIIKRLQHQLACEKRKAQLARAELYQYREVRNEYEAILKACIEEVKMEVRKYQQEWRKSEHSPELNKSDRKEVVKLLVSNERLLSLLYDKAFPVLKKHESAFTSSLPDL